MNKILGVLEGEEKRLIDYLINDPNKISASKMAETKQTRINYDMHGNQRPEMTTHGNLAIIPVVGPIIKDGGNLAKWLGMADVTEITDNFISAMMAPEIDYIVFDINSPGGVITGVPELAKLIAASEKPTMAYTGGYMASAAYWIGSACTVVYATESAEAVGSIGVFIAIYDLTEAQNKEGISVKVYRSGPYKAAGLDGITDKQAKLLQETVNIAGQRFKRAVKSRRSLVSDDDMQGQGFDGATAAEKNLTGGVVINLEDAIIRFLTDL